MTTQLQSLEADILTGGVIDDAAVDIIRRELPAANRIEKELVTFLLLMRQKARSVCLAFERLVFEALKDNALRDGSIGAEEARWLRQVLFADGKITEDEKALLRELKREARRTSPEFQVLYGECMN
jgi:hypothetical protein